MARIRGSGGRRRPAGRPRGSKRGSVSITRRRILEAASEIISLEGIHRLSLRKVARRAGITPALVYHYFPDKNHLVLEALQQSFSALRPAAVDGAPDFVDLGERIASRFVSTWGVPKDRPVILGVLRAVTEDERAADLFRSLTEESILPAAAADLGKEARRRVALVGSILWGTALFRYLLKIEPLASASDEEFASIVGSLVTVALGGTLPQ